ncbi:MAG: T9SS type A sorting domain-containing protein [Sphingobacteriales bacterium]|nr:MAG: T9SS type A sorting domain-containing protein [Sphingobacteriales bacterium]
MKKIIGALLTGATLLSFSNARAQATYPYDFSYSTQPYAELTGETTLILGSDGWDDTMVNFSLPINFQYQGEPVTQWTMDTYGGLYPNELDLGLGAPFIFGIHTDYEDVVGATISYQVSGNTGSRIAKVEYKNVGFWGGGTTDFANFQIWLYEGSNKIEYHVGPNDVTPGTFDYPEGDGDALVVGLLYEAGVLDTVMFHGVQLMDNGQHSDTAVLTDPTGPGDAEELLLLYGQTYPVNGSVFTFEVPSGVSAIAKIPKQVSNIYPNPATDRLTVQLKEAKGGQLNVYSITGKKLLSQPVTGTTNQVSLTGLSKGVYLLQYSTAAGQRETYRFIKK